MALRNFLTFMCSVSLLSVHTNVFAAAKITPATVKAWCHSTRPGSVVKTLINEVIPDAELRKAFVRLLAAGQGAQCSVGLSAYFDELSKQKNLVALKKEAGVKALLVMGLAAKDAGAVRIVEREILDGALEEWLPTLEQANPLVYASTLRRWASSHAALARSHADLTEQKQVNALLADRYFQLLKQGSIVSESDFRNVNMLYASTNGASRDAYNASLVGLMRKHDSVWLPTVRNEPHWAQLRLLPLMVKVGGPEVMRELMWMSDASQDNRVRALANRSIDDLVK